MSLYDIDLSILLSSTSILPPDISLKIIPDPEDGDEEEVVVVLAHRHVLSLLSPVFRVYLSRGGEWWESSNEVIIKDVSGKAFKIMIDFFYKKDFILSQEFANMKDIFEILKVADRFQVDKLVNLCKKALKKFPVEISTVVDIVNTAKAYGSLAPFVAISKEIIMEASEHLEAELDILNANRSSDVLKYLAQSQPDDFKRLVEHAEDTIKIVESVIDKECNQCGEHLFDEDKHKVTHKNDECSVIYENMVAGARVVVTERSKFKHDSQEELEAGHQGKILKSYSKVKYVIKWDNVDNWVKYDISGNLYVPMRYIRS